MERITSLKNEYIKQLCRLKNASARRETGTYLVEGPKLCAEAMQSGQTVLKCLVTEREAHHPLLNNLPPADVVMIPDHVAGKLTSMETCPGIFMLLRQVEPVSPAAPRFVLALDHLADPANLGTILRSAEAFGTELVLLSDGSVDLYAPKVLRAAMGSVFRVPVRRGPLAALLTEYKKAGFQILGAGLDRSFQHLPEVSFQEPTVVVIGNESNGITPEIAALCDSGVFIPMLGQNESLNAAAAASIILWEQSKWR